MANAIPAPSVVSEPHIEASLCYHEGRGDIWVIEHPNFAVGFHSVLKKNSWLLAILLFKFFARNSKESKKIAVACSNVVLFKCEPLVVADLFHRLEGNACVVVNWEKWGWVSME